MNKAVSVVKFDLLTVKPYIKSVLFFIPIGILLGISNKDAMLLPPMFMVWATLFAAYPFSIGEKNSLDKFLGTTSLKRKSVITGRYLFSCFSAFIILLLALIMVVLTYVYTKTPVDLRAVVFVSSVSIFLYSFIISFQIPLYFKLGYLKAKAFTFIPLFGVGFIVPAIKFIPTGNSISDFLKWLSNIIEFHPYLSSMAFICISAVTLSVSHAISYKIYRNREL
jgi:ABC-type transport system involved in multi-copper enzyme maturation permease subunit